MEESGRSYLRMSSLGMPDPANALVECDSAALQVILLDDVVRELIAQRAETRTLDYKGPSHRGRNWSESSTSHAS
jgi:hypothetical protein